MIGVPSYLNAALRLQQHCPSLLGESRFDVGNQRGVEPIIVHQKVGNPVVLEIPEHPFNFTDKPDTVVQMVPLNFMAI